MSQKVCKIGHSKCPFETECKCPNAKDYAIRSLKRLMLKTRCCKEDLVISDIRQIIDDVLNKLNRRKP